MRESLKSKVHRFGKIQPRTLDSIRCAAYIFQKILLSEEGTAGENTYRIFGKILLSPNLALLVKMYWTGVSLVQRWSALRKCPPYFPGEIIF